MSKEVAQWKQSVIKITPPESGESLTHHIADRVNLDNYIRYGEWQSSLLLARSSTLSQIDDRKTYANVRATCHALNVIVEPLYFSQISIGHGRPPEASFLMLRELGELSRTSGNRPSILTKRLVINLNFLMRDARY
ncbi:hypothetical protein BT96DRAFT_992479 [Gymnopus androsaceus JB14]|uniref:Uncharacterized protein n=1 Tax=Gymnopus androsaceus JB14 TaxID=1447944 RepID=A0A6A4HVJ3_9AGAR|nr:hypothetical protein BT96DRAFT_992479 [Gymnopus androsaceus JB14]